ncbi:MAG: DNA (cytosine-5-)-methyltransferase [Candidatus Eisenbacteria bacterium]|uniref:Cytosine-specific methyltransferase n=1 Tax=Eiseniibacteriota bacterium TaxID=2212470 RepID=A0A956NH27_UNCEI|nr:DNA (cytosine-5-)-methyltransferase [Candidatus Eisenbacteria bacterium]
MSKPVAEPRQLRTVGLFAGIGGIEAGLESAGHQTRLLCELDRGACAVLEDRFPGVPIHTDICTLEDVPRGTDLIAGGFPCQDLSQAGQTRGISGAQSGLVHQVFRLLEKRRVPWVLLENVPFMLQLAQGRALEVVVENLERLGYSWAYRVVETRAFGLPQRRQRVFFLASLEEDPRRVLFSHEVEPPMEPAYDPENRPACGFYWTEGVRGLGWAVDAVPTLKGGSTVGVPSPPAIWLPSDQIVTPSIGDAERLQGFRKHWTKPAEAVVRRGARWKMVGNAVTVPVAKWVGERLAQPTDFELGLERRLHDGGRWPHAAWNVGEGRFTAHVSSWPVRKKRRPLAEFLKDEPTLLSHRATAGFLERTTRGSLRFPIGFLDAVARHRERMAKSNEEKVVVG